MAAAVAQPIITSFPSGTPVDWPEPVQRVQLLAESGLSAVPSQYIRPESERPAPLDPQLEEVLEIPQIDLSGFEDEKKRKLILAQIAFACEQWGFFSKLSTMAFPCLFSKECCWLPSNSLSCLCTRSKHMRTIQ